jgi:hypothetical protein
MNRNLTQGLMMGLKIDWMKEEWREGLEKGLMIQSS